MKLIRSFLYAGRGIIYCFKAELNFKIHVLVTVIVVAMGFYFCINFTEWLLIIGCCTLVLAMELVNTAVEKLCDRVTKQTDPLIKIIKDLCAGAVLICAMGSVITGLIIFIPKMFCK